MVVRAPALARRVRRRVEVAEELGEPRARIRRLRRRERALALELGERVGNVVHVAPLDDARPHLAVVSRRRRLRERQRRPHRRRRLDKPRARPRRRAVEERAVAARDAGEREHRHVVEQVLRARAAHGVLAAELRRRVDVLRVRRELCPRRLGVVVPPRKVEGAAVASGEVVVDDDGLDVGLGRARRLREQRVVRFGVRRQVHRAVEALKVKVEARARRGAQQQRRARRRRRRDEAGAARVRGGPRRSSAATSPSQTP